MGVSQIFGSLTGGGFRVQHFTVFLPKVLSEIITIIPVDESKAFIALGGIISDKKGVTYCVEFISPTEVEVRQSDKKANTTIHFSVVSAI